jgi:hypothetical protein
MGLAEDLRALQELRDRSEISEQAYAAARDRLVGNTGSGEDRGIRWQQLAIAHLGYTLNLTFTLVVAAIVYCFSLLKDKEFAPSCSAKETFLAALILLFLSALTGFVCILVRLWDIRETWRRARNDPQRMRQGEVRMLDRLTLWLFYSHCVTFGAGIAALAIAFLLIYGQKLV